MRADPRPDVSLCRDCALEFLERELSAFRGRVIAFEPDGENVTQYFFVPRDDFQSAGLVPELSEALRPPHRAAQRFVRIMFRSRAMDVVSAKRGAKSRRFRQRLFREGRQLCAKHGAEQLCAALEKIEQCNLLYVNIPSGEAGAYVWI